MRSLTYQLCFLVILYFQNFANCELRSVDVQEGSCVNIPTNVSSTDLAFVFSNLNPWYYPMASAIVYRTVAEAMLYNRSLADQDEFNSLQMKSSVPYLSVSDLLLPAITLSPIAMGSLLGFGGTKVVKFNGVITGYFSLRDSCTNQVLPNLNYNPPDINCSALNPHQMTVVETHADDGWFLINLCYTVTNQRGWAVLSRNPTLSQNAINRVTEIVTNNGYSEDYFAYQTY